MLIREPFALGVVKETRKGQLEQQQRIWLSRSSQPKAIQHINCK